MGHVFSARERHILKSSVAIFVVSVLWALGGVMVGFVIDIPARGGTYTEGIVGEPNLLNPLFSLLHDVDADIVRMIYSGLMRYDSEGQLVPDLAERYDVSEDQKTYTFFLRKGIVWHDGEPFDADDVVFTFEMIQHPSVGSPLRVGFSGVTAEAVDDATIRFVLPEPFYPFLSSLTVGIIPKHIWESITPERIRFARQNVEPIGTGPFQVKKFIRDETGFITQYQLDRFEAFYRDMPYLEKIVFRFFGSYDEIGGVIPAFREQKIDGISFVPYHLREKVARKHSVVRTIRLPQYTALFFQADQQPILEDATVRLALETAINKEQIVKESLRGEGTVIHGPILPGFPGFTDIVSTTPYQTEESIRLLDSLSEKKTLEEYQKETYDALLKEELTRVGLVTTTALSDVSSSLREQIEKDTQASVVMRINPAQTVYRKIKTGAWMELALVTADTPEYRQAAGLIVGFWQDIGVKTNVTFVEPKDMRSALKDRAYDILLYSFILGSDSDQYPFWHSSQINYPGLNVSRYVNREVDALLTEMRSGKTKEVIADLSQKFQEKIREDRPAIFLYSPLYTYVTSDRVQGIRLSGVFTPADRFADITGWYVKTKKQWRKSGE